MVSVDTCCICGDSDFTKVYDAEDHYSGERFSLQKCVGCGHVVTSPRPNGESLGSYYPESYYGSEGKRFNTSLEKVVQYFRTRIADAVTSHFDMAGRVLEVGSGRGTLLAELARRGWEAFGTEYSASMAETTVNNFGVTVYNTPNLADCQFPDEHFDVIICYHVLEHMPEHQETLREMRRISKQNGLLLLAVPNFGGAMSTWSKEQWFAIDVPRHLGHFSPATLKRSLDESNFSIIKERTLSIEQDVFGFVQSVMNLMGLPYNMFYDLIRAPEARMRYKETGGITRASVFALGAVLTLAGLPYSIITAMMGRGGTLEYWAKPA